MSTDLLYELDRWWDRIDDDLGRLEANPEFERDALRSSELFDMYKVRMTSLEGYVIAAWFSVPTGDAPFPAILYTPTYMSVVTPAPTPTWSRAFLTLVPFRAARCWSTGPSATATTTPPG